MEGVGAGSGMRSRGGGGVAGRAMTAAESVGSEEDMMGRWDGEEATVTEATVRK